MDSSYSHSLTAARRRAYIEAGRSGVHISYRLFSIVYASKFKEILR